MTDKSINVIGNNTEADHLLHKYFVPNLHKAYIEIGEDKFCMPITYVDWAEKLSKFEVKDTDIFVTGVPRSGSTWLSEMIWLIVNNQDYQGAHQRITERFPILEVCTFFDENRTGGFNTSQLSNTDAFNYVIDLKDPRCIKSHLHWSLLPEEIVNGTKKPKIIYIYRDPKDLCVSYYNLHRMICEYRGTFEEFCTLFLEGRLLATPFWKQVLSFWNQRHRQNMLFIKYKDMKEDLCAVIKQVANFLEKELTNIEIQQLMDHLNIENMRKNPALNREDDVEKFAKRFKLKVTDANSYIGSGIQNSYKSVMSPDLIQRFDEWTQKQLSETDFTA